MLPNAADVFLEKIYGICALGTLLITVTELPSDGKCKELDHERAITV